VSDLIQDMRFVMYQCNHSMHIILCYIKKGL